MAYDVTLHVQADPHLSLEETHVLGGKVKGAIRGAVPQVQSVLARGHASARQDCLRRRTDAAKAGRTNRGHAPKIDWPSKKELLRRLKCRSVVALAKELRVSDQVLRQHLKRHGVTQVPDGRRSGASRPRVSRSTTEACSMSIGLTRGTGSDRRVNDRRGTGDSRGARCSATLNTRKRV
jgi:hypothetical protein